MRAREKGTQSKKEAEEGRRRRVKLASLLRLETKRKTFEELTQLVLYPNLN